MRPARIFSPTVGAARLQIGVLARRTGCNIETIRYYEKIGMLAPPPRTEGGFRLYSADDVRVLSFIRRARGLGFALPDVREMLRLMDERAQPCAAIQAVAARHVAAIRARVADLLGMEAAMAALMESCANGAPTASCPLIETLSAAPTV